MMAKKSSYIYKVRLVHWYIDKKCPQKFTPQFKYGVKRGGICYILFVIEERWVHFCSTQKCMNHDKTYIAAKQRKSQKDSIVNL